MEPPDVVQEFATLCHAREFISHTDLDHFVKMAAGWETGILAHLDAFTKATCPACGREGFFKWHFLGKLSHPSCGHHWHVPPWHYFGRQIAATFNAGLRTAVSIDDSNTPKEERGGCVGMVLSFCITVLFRSPFIVLMTPVQTVAWIFSRIGDRRNESDPPAEEDIGGAGVDKADG